MDQPSAVAKARLKAQRPAHPSKQWRVFRDKLFVGFTIAAVVLCLAVIVSLLVKVRSKDFVVPLQYSTLQGFDALGSWYRIYAFGAFSLLVTIGNLLLANLAYEKSRLASFLLVLGTVIVNLFSLVVVLTLVSHLEV
jgi:hypothetical protein